MMQIYEFPIKRYDINFHIFMKRLALPHSKPSLFIWIFSEQNSFNIEKVCRFIPIFDLYWWIIFELYTLFLHFKVILLCTWIIICPDRNFNSSLLFASKLFQYHFMHTSHMSTFSIMIFVIIFYQYSKTVHSIKLLC